ncbi:MAG TPA: SHOCT domain-containing protein [Acidiferrobacterales bacterium]|nr:SHOCT domain-containing protein [Acidiferrobacterales bacterium]
MNKKYLFIGVLLILGVTGCSSKAGNIGLGAGAAGAAYEYSNKRALEKLDKDYQEGKITKEEYDRRRKDIQSHSIIYR